MRVLMCGLGDIARKAYLPVLATMPGLELHLTTRNPEVLAELGAAYRLKHLHFSLDAALATTTFDAAFVHSATTAHPEIVERLLDRRIPTFVDKPLADNLGEAERLVQLAEARSCLLTVGFNRRFAPDYAALRPEHYPFILMQKHRRAQPDLPRRVVFDDFIHVVDTLLFLTKAPSTRVTIETLMDNGLLSGVTLMLGGSGHQAVGTMQRNSGLDEERIDLIGEGRKHAVVDLAERFDHDGAVTRHRRGDWTPVARQRGFDAMCADFLAGVKEGRSTAAHDILETHRLCEAIVAHAEARD
ncbi:Gfo/Idh/MocA family oxidoreductase [Sphingomonas sp. PB2P12]|uniref:Gfo/Idh/MocA family protein n=1 Tax=Sphingomonas sandaracina TaxID=3096157 RepID=UPI002FCBE1DC